MSDSFHHLEHIDVKHPTVRSRGFSHLAAQSINAGLFLMDYEGLCRARGVAQMVDVARAVAHRRQRLWNPRAGTFDQPVAAIGLAANATFVDPRWNCRRPMAFVHRCFIAHSKTLMALVRDRASNTTGGGERRAAEPGPPRPVADGAAEALARSGGAIHYHRR
mmetsp:Transcript_13303/g.45116  ORF Transcript_13303/g.45116 Transcript_13303/m.45116 type:complete len:163 (+) Transcript_13303:283-771(+)